MAGTKIYLVPGFFGFASIGALNYFHRVGDVLDEALDERGIDAEIIQCTTQPTGSIRKRADEVLRQVVETGGLEADDVHFVGHSTGGLDIRLLVTPGVQLRDSDEEDRLGERTRSVISLATPHYGTPLANFFTTMQGRHVLQLLTLLATNTGGRYAIFAASQMIRLAASVDDRLGRDETFLDNISKQFLSAVTLGKDDELWAFLRAVRADQGAIIQLTPEGTHLYNAAVTERDDTDYHSIVTVAPPPSLSQAFRDVLAPQRAAMYAIFASMWRLAANEHSQYPYPSLNADMASEVDALIPFDVDAGSNDGVVPSLSQIHGNLLDAVVADHLDVVGQFRNSGGNELADWLPSGSRFDEARFRRVWGKVADAVDAARS